MRCSIALCNSDNQSPMFDKQTMFFRFPTNPELLKLWVDACKRKDRFIPSNGRVCSKHFPKDCYLRDLRFELTGYSSRNHRLLKEDAVPTLNLPCTKHTESSISSKKQNRIDRRERKKMVCDILKSASLSTSHCTDAGGQHRGKSGPGPRIINVCGNYGASPEIKEVSHCINADGQGSMTSRPAPEIIDVCENDVPSPQTKNVGHHSNADGQSSVKIEPVPEIIDVCGSYAPTPHMKELSHCTNADGQSSMKSDPVPEIIDVCGNYVLSPQIKEVGTNTEPDDRDNTIIQLRREIDNLKRENEVFQTLFSSTQIKKLKNPMKKVTWTTEDIARGIVIHSAGAEAYRLLLEKGYPLPAVSTLRRWCSKIKM